MPWLGFSSFSGDLDRNIRMTFLRFRCILHIFNMQKCVVKKVLASGIVIILLCKKECIFNYCSWNHETE